MGTSLASQETGVNLSEAPLCDTSMWLSSPLPAKTCRYREGGLRVGRAGRLAERTKGSIMDRLVKLVRLAGLMSTSRRPTVFTGDNTGTRLRRWCACGITDNVRLRWVVKPQKGCSEEVGPLPFDGDFYASRGYGTITQLLLHLRRVLRWALLLLR